MDSNGQHKLPVIDFNEKNLTPGTSSWNSSSDQVRRALEVYGCFIVTYNKLSSKQQVDTFDMWQELFDLPKKTKKKHTSELAGFGYGGIYPLMPMFEFFGIEDGETLDAAQKFTNLMWPDGHDKFCESIYSYCKVLEELSSTVIGMATSSYGLEKYCDSLIESSFYMTRLVRYGAPGENENCMGLVPHRDKNFLAVIGTNEAKGLEIETPDGEWISFEPSPSKFIVIVGEAFMAWSNERIYCPLHRVISRGTKAKCSIGLFSFIRGILQVPEELVDDENPLKFKPFSNMEFLEYCNEEKPKVKGAIQAFCGV